MNCGKGPMSTNSGKEEQEEGNTRTPPLVADWKNRGLARVRKRSQDGFLGFQEQGQQLLPGILDEVTLDRICTKLPWKTFYTLSSVSRGWKRAIRSGQVNDARVRAQSTETLIVINHVCPDTYKYVMGLYSVSDKSFYQLPTIGAPILYTIYFGIPLRCRCISLDGKLYVLGGSLDDAGDGDEVYVMDLAGQSQWQQCARMKSRRKDFGVGVLDGKIYVFGGIYYGGPVFISEVYDPEFDRWDPIQYKVLLEDPIQYKICPRFYHHVTAMGKELCLHGGSFFTNLLNTRISTPEPAYSLEFYHPGKDEWRTVNYFGLRRENMFIAHGKLHSITGCDIDVFDSDKNTWTGLHSFSLAGIGRAVGHAWNSIVIVSWATLAVGLDNELVALLSWFPREHYSSKNRRCLLHSVGFGSKTERIVWQKAQCPVEIGYDHICPIQL